MGTITWTGTLTALSSVSHGGTSHGTRTLLRRERVFTPDGRLIEVPVISGNHLRGRLRRVGEELLRDTLEYEGQLAPAAAHVLRGGGALAKTSGEPLSGSRLAILRALVPQIGVFGGAGGGTIISGALAVGKVVPHLAETARITGVDSPVSAFGGTQLEAYTRRDETDQHDFADVLTVATSARLTFDDTGRPDIVDAPAVGGGQMLFHVETFPAGTVFSTWLRLSRPTSLELAFFADVLSQYEKDGRLGGRVAIGHGQVRTDLVPDPTPHVDVDWRAFVTENRTDILTALGELA